jgi:hypothetical protein
MRRQQQGWGLLLLALCGIGLVIWLDTHVPRVNGHSLQQVELTASAAQMQATEYKPLYRWLGVDSLFAAIYTVLFTWGLRWLATGVAGGRLDLLGRALSWVTAVAILFDLLENAILWVGADIGASSVSAWLPALVKLKWLSAVIFFAYGILWLGWRRRPVAAVQGSANS